MYKKYRQRTTWAITHAWSGRIFLTLGMINGGLGLMMTEAHHQNVQGKIAYGVLAGLMWLSWMAAIGWTRLRPKATSGETEEKSLGHNDSGESSPDRYRVQCKDA